MANLPVTKAPKPPTPLRASSWKPPAPGPSQPPQDLPGNYPNNLKVRTWNVIAGAIEEFPWQSQILDLCRRVISKLAPAFCTEIRESRLRADLAPSHMSDLLHYLLVHNVNSYSEPYRLEQELKRSKEWHKFVRRLKKAEERSGSKPRQKKEEPGPRSAAPKPQALLLEEPKKRPSYSQKEAAQLLICTDRQIRNLCGKHSLNRTPNGRVVNDARLKAEYEARHNAVKYL